MNNKLIMTAVIALTLSLTACGTSDTGDTTENEAAQATESEAVQAAEDGSEQDTEDESKLDTEDEITSETEEVSDDGSSSEEPAADPEPDVFTPVEGLSENYADLDKRCFAYDGKIFTLGETTFQDMVDAGISFDENDLNNIGNNINKNYETARYTVRVNDYVSMQFIYINTTDTNITEGECLLSYVRWNSIYVPQPDYEDSLNEQIRENISDASKHVCFSFPLTLTKDQLLENNSEPTEETESNYVTYRVDSEVYMGSSGYTFEFNKETDQLKEVSISWLP